MNTVYKILLFSLLSFSLPIGKLFEIFVWDSRVIKTECVFEKQSLESNGRLCYFVNLAKEIQKKLSIHLQVKPDVAIIERVICNQNGQSLAVQKNKVDSIKALLISRFLFNVLYFDDSEIKIVA